MRVGAGGGPPRTVHGSREMRGMQMRADRCHISPLPRVAWKESWGGQARQRPVSPISSIPHLHSGLPRIPTALHAILLLTQGSHGQSIHEHSQELS